MCNQGPHSFQEIPFLRLPPAPSSSMNSEPSLSKTFKIQTTAQNFMNKKENRKEEGSRKSQSSGALFLSKSLSCIFSLGCHLMDNSLSYQQSQIPTGVLSLGSSSQLWSAHHTQRTAGLTGVSSQQPEAVGFEKINAMDIALQTGDLGLRVIEPLGPSARAGQGAVLPPQRL